MDFGVIDGKRRQFFARNERAARIKAIEKTKILEKAGASALKLKSSELHEAQQCFARLNILPQHVSLSSVLDFYFSHNPTDIQTATVAQVHEDQIASQVKKGLRQKSIASTRAIIKGFVALHGNASISDIVRSDIEQWLEGKSFKSAITQTNAIRYLSGFFNYAKKKGLITSNPVNGVDRPEITFKMPEYMSADNVEKLLRIASDREESIVPKLALGFFAGIRPYELDRLDWSDVKWADKIITIRPEVAKCRIARHVTMQDNLVQWLINYRRQSGSIGIMKKQFRLKRINLCKMCGISEWPHDAMRRTFATFHIAMFQDAGKTSTELGHIGQGSSVLYRHYRGLATKADAERFWGISPVVEGNLIRMIA